MNETSLSVRSEQNAVARHDELSNLQRVGNILAASGYFSDARDMAQAAVKVMAGGELGIPPVASMMGINIIKGKVALGATMIASRIRAHGYDFRPTRFDNSGCKLQFLGKRGDPDIGFGLVGDRPILGDSEFTEADAKQAQCFTEMYKKYPRNMYYSRAISNGAKWFTPDVFGGAPVYTPEELGARVDENGDFVAEPTKAEAKQAQAEVLAEKMADIPEEVRAKYERPTTAEVVEPEQMDPAITAMWARMAKGKFEALKEFQKLKAAFVSVLGSEDAGHAEYYAIINRYGAEKADQFKKRGDAKAAARDMYERLLEITKGQHEDSEATLAHEQFIEEAND